jgi:hypothetical protein
MLSMAMAAAMDGVCTKTETGQPASAWSAIEP